MKLPAFYTNALTLGDILSSTPTVKKLSEIYEHPVRVFSMIPELFAGLPYVSGSEDIREWKDISKEKWLRKNYDVHYTFAKIGKKVLLSDDRGIELRHSQIDIRQYHAIDLGFNLLPSEMQCHFIPLTEKDIELPKDYIVIHPSKTWNSRSWDIKNWNDLCENLISQDIAVVIIGKDSIQEEVENFNRDNENAEDRLKDELASKSIFNIDRKGVIDLTNKTTISQLWHVLNNASVIVTMDSGVLHLAGTTNTNIIQLGSSINPFFRAPYRYGNQEYKYQYIKGSCDIFCGSNMKYSLRDWNERYNGATPIQSLSLIDQCLENKPVFECHPSVNQVMIQINKVLKYERLRLKESESQNQISLGSRIEKINEQSVYDMLHKPKIDIIHPEYREETVYKVSFKIERKENNCPILHIIGNKKDERIFVVTFTDFNSGKVIYSTNIKTGHWVSPESHYFTKWGISVTSDGESFFNHIDDELPECIEIVSNALGDTIGALAVIEKYRVHSDVKKIDVICVNANLFINSYPNLNLIDRDKNKIFATRQQLKINEPRKIYYQFNKPLMQGYADQLGISIEGIKTRIDHKERKAANIDLRTKKYFCFSMHSTAQAKHWNHPEGWKKLCSLLKDEGYIPVCIDRTPTFGIEGWFRFNQVPNNAKRKSSNDLSDAIKVIQGAEFFVGLSSGMSWVANALNIPTVIISGVTSFDNEFTGDNVLRINDESVCNACFHRETFDASDWLWCPLHKNTPDHFICTKNITPDQVYSKIIQQHWYKNL